ncbi:MAG: sigma-70 family RNA polymerase sigma factor [Myxococcota bacterium]
MLDEGFIREHRPLVVAVAKKLQAQFQLTIETDDLVSDGFTGLIEARSRFDAGRGVSFRTFAYYRVRGSMLDEVRRQSYLPRGLHLQLKKAQAADTVCEHLETDVATRGSANYKVATALSSIAVAHALCHVGSEPSAGSSKGELRIDERSSPERAALLREQAQRLRCAVERLPSRERALVRGHYFEDRRFDEVAQSLGISKSWASRLHSKALAQLKTDLDE